MPSFALVKLAEIAAINPRLEANLSADEAVSFVPMAALSSISAKVVAEEIRPYAAVAKGYTPFLANDVLVAKITPCFENNKIGQANLSRPVGFGSTEFHVIRPHKGRADARYLIHYLRQDHVRSEGERKMTGSAGQRRVPEYYLAGLALPLPSLHEQRRIAAILDQADALRAKRRAALVQLDEMAQAIFIEMFGDPITNHRGWERVRIDQVAEIITGSTPSRAILHYYGSDIEWIKSDNLNTGSYYATRADERLSEAGKRVARTAPSGATLVTCIAGSPTSIGNAAMLNREVAFNQQINAVVPISANPHFLHAQLRIGKIMVQEASTGAMKGMVSKSRFENIKVISPPAKLQNQFARSAIALERQRRTSADALAKLDSLFASLQHRAFRGEL